MTRFLRGKKRVTLPFTWWSKVNALVREKSYDQVYLSCEKRLQEKPQDWRKIQRIGLDLAEKSLWVEAERFLNLASQGVQDSGLLESRGDVLEKIYYSYIHEPWAIGKLEEAFECWRRSLELNPRNLSLQLRLGATLMVVGSIQEAQAIFTEENLTTLTELNTLSWQRTVLISDKRRRISLCKKFHRTKRGASNQ